MQVRSTVIKYIEFAVGSLTKEGLPDLYPLRTALGQPLLL